MKRLLSHPVTNVVGISIFTLFYALIFVVTSEHLEFQGLLYYNRNYYNNPDFWHVWSGFLDAGYQRYIAYVLIAVTALIVILLLLRRRPYDEYHLSILMQCLVVALVLTLLSIALFYLMILSDSNGIVEKFTLFITIHWVTVVLADFVYVLICRWK